MNYRTALATLALCAAVGRAAEQPSASAPAPAPAMPADHGGHFVVDWNGPASASDERIYVEASYLLWWMRGDSVPALLTGSPVGTPINFAGVRGSPGTAVLFGDSKTNGDLRSGGLITAGGWIDSQHTLAVEGSFFMLENKAAGIRARSDGSVILARPFTDAATGASAAERVAFPGNLAGDFQALDASGGLVGVGVLFRDRLCAGCNYSLDALGGYRFLRFTDRIGINEQLTSLDVNNPFNVAPGTTIAVGDSFTTKNQFHGFDAGLQGEIRRGSAFVNLLAKVAVGVNDQRADISGVTTATVPGAGTFTSAGGLLALSRNSGHFSRDEISVIPEFGMKLGYQISPRLRASVGYTVLFWNNVVRAGDQIDTTVNQTLIPPATAVTGPTRPLLRFERTDLLTQGFDLGVEFRY